jgi:hypothetical protein
MKLIKKKSESTNLFVSTLKGAFMLSKPNHWNFSGKTAFFAISAAAALIVAACGGGSSSSKVEIIGTAATGAPMANATVTARCASDRYPGQVVGKGTSAADGTFSVVVEYGLAPCALRPGGS